MAQEDNKQPPAAAPALHGLAARLIDALTRHTETALTAPVGEDVEKVVRLIALIARAATAVHALQAAEERAAQRMVDAAVERAGAGTRAGFYNDEDDEMTPHGRDPRLDDPERVGEIYQEARDALDELHDRFEKKFGDGGSVGRVFVAAEASVDHEGEGSSAPAD